MSGGRHSTSTAARPRAWSCDPLDPIVPSTPRTTSRVTTDVGTRRDPAGPGPGSRARPRGRFGVRSPPRRDRARHRRRAVSVRRRGECHARTGSDRSARHARDLGGPVRRRLRAHAARPHRVRRRARLRADAAALARSTHAPPRRHRRRRAAPDVARLGSPKRPTGRTWRPVVGLELGRLVLLLVLLGLGGLLLGLLLGLLRLLDGLLELFFLLLGELLGLLVLGLLDLLLDVLLGLVRVLLEGLRRGRLA